MNNYHSPIFPGLVVPVKRSDLSEQRTVPGGLVASYADITAAEEARELAALLSPHFAARTDWVTRLLQVDFVSPLEAGDTLRTSGQVVAVGKRSLTLEVMVYNDNSFVDGSPAVVARARAVMVSVQNHIAVEHHLSIGGLVQGPAVTSLIRQAGQVALTGQPQELTHSNLMFPKVLNPQQSVFGGYIAEMVDQAAAVHAQRLLHSANKDAELHAAGACFVTRALEVNYLAPIELGDQVQIYTMPIRHSESTLSFSFQIEARHRRTRSSTAVGSGEVVLVAWTPADGKKYTHGLF